MGESTTKVGGIEFNRLYDFVDYLRVSGYKIDTRQLNALSDLLITLLARGERITDLHQLKTLIAPIICSTPSEQDDFYRRFDNWPFSFEEVTLAKSDQLQEEQSKWGKGVRVVQVLVILVVMVLCSLCIGLSPPIRTFLFNALFGILSFLKQLWVPSVLLLSMSFAGMLAWWSWKIFKENQFITRELANQQPVYTKVPLKANMQEVMPTPRFKPIVSALRRRVRVYSTDVDVEKTIESAVKNCNWLEIVYRQRQMMPEYLVLVDRKSSLDQQARFVLEILQRLVNDGVWLHPYEFNSDPRVCFPLDKKDFPLLLSDLQSSHADARLMVFISKSELVNPLTGELVSWLEPLRHWSKRAILTPDNMSNALLEELNLRDFTVLPLTLESLASMVHSFEIDTPFFLFNSALPLPAPLIERPLYWIGYNAPPETEVEALIAEVKLYLGENGFYWLCACAVYPELRWELTLYLGSKIKDSTDRILLDIDILLRLTRLPWFRYGYMPNWLRLALINHFTEEQEAHTRVALSELLTMAFQGESFELEIAKKDPEVLRSFVNRLVRVVIRHSSRESSARDYIFVRFILKPQRDILAVSIPDEVRNRFMNIKGSNTKQGDSSSGRRNNLTFINVFLKLFLDLLISIYTIIFLSPFLLFIAIAIKLDSPGPVIYRRRVMGINGRQFDAYKFRTMHVNGDEILKHHPEWQVELAHNFKLKNDPRVTRVGRLLRSWSLDELPQYFNVLKKEMSLVGPRIITPDEVEKYNKWIIDILTMRPGITGLWQVSGRWDLTNEERVQLEMYYIRNWSIWLDLQVLFRTIPAVIKRRGAF